MKLLKIPAIVVSGFSLGPGKGDVFKGDAIELDPYTYRVELERGRIKLVPVDNSAVTAEALVQARAELIEKISQALTVEDLEKLLSEDPEIVAAYEKRLEELGATEPIAAEATVEAAQVEEVPVEAAQAEEVPVEDQPALPVSGKAKK